MVKQKSKPLFQFCIFETYVNEVLALPKEIQIDEITFGVGFSLKGVVKNVPAQLAELGVTYMREPSVSMEAKGTLTGKRKHMEKCGVDICHHLSLDYRHMRATRVIMSYEDVTTTFTRMTKKMAGKEGMTYHARVLGLVVTEGSEASADKIIKVLGAKKIHCQYSVQPVRTVICTV